MARARTSEAKEQRSKDILLAARTLLKDNNYNNIKVVDIAKLAGVSKALVFVYFKTKEMIFMDLLKDEYRKRFKHLKSYITSNDKISKDEFYLKFLEEMEEILDPESIFIKLTTIKTSILGKNIDMDNLIKSNLFYYEEIDSFCDEISSKVNDLPKKQILEILQVQEALIVGFRNAVDLPDTLLSSFNDYNLDGYKIDFKKNALTAMKHYLNGFK
jgi:AcrR family transcriptional regulator